MSVSFNFTIQTVEIVNKETHVHATFTYSDDYERECEVNYIRHEPSGRVSIQYIGFTDMDTTSHHNQAVLSESILDLLYEG